jgi:hypothetical protein
LIRKHRQDSSWEKRRKNREKKIKPAGRSWQKEKEKKSASYLSAGDEEDGASDGRDFFLAVPFHSQQQRLRHG